VLWLAKGALVGDCVAQYHYALHFFVKLEFDKAFYWLRLAADQFLSEAICEIGGYYKNGCGCERNQVLAAKCFVSSGFLYRIIDHLQSQIDSTVLFVYGQAFCNNAMSYQNLAGPMKYKAINIYKRATNAARAAALCFTWAFKGNRYLNKDVIKMIAQMVYQSRETPDIWGIE
jgi:hypothetical protein